MKTRPAYLFCLLFLALVVIGGLYVLIQPQPDPGRKLFAKTRQILRQKRFKTDLSEFDLSSPPQMMEREAILKAAVSGNTGSAFAARQDFMEPIGIHSAIVVWRQDILKTRNGNWPNERDELTWDDLRKTLVANQPQLDAACAAILSGPISFNLDASRGYAMPLPHLEVLKNLTQELSSRLLLMLHDGDEGAAFTNLMAATRLVTTWKVEPLEISHLVLFADENMVFNATWQALQTKSWPDDQLARLQEQWESVNFLTNLPEIVAFQRACHIAAQNQNTNETAHPSIMLRDFLHDSWSDPLNLWHTFQYQLRHRAYLRWGQYEDGKEALLFYRNREIEMRKAVLAGTWLQMRQLPGVAKEITFKSKYSSRAQTIENVRRLTLIIQKRGISFLACAAEAEAERRILITALALERYLGKHGCHANSLAALVPEFLTAMPLDFMDGQPLRYRLYSDGSNRHFLLYSVGLNCIEDGGKFPTRPKNGEDWQIQLGIVRMFGSDILWPLPASAPEAVTVLQK